MPHFYPISKGQISISVYGWKQEILSSVPSAGQNFIMIITANMYLAFTIYQVLFQKLYITSCSPKPSQVVSICNPTLQMRQVRNKRLSNFLRSLSW